MSLDDIIRAWQAGEPDTLDALETLLGQSDAAPWDYYDSSITDPIDELERTALESIHSRSTGQMAG